MKSRIAHKFMLAMIIQAVGGVILTVLLTNLALDWNFRRYLRDAQEDQNRRIVETLAELYSESVTWMAVRHSTRHVGSTTGTQLLVFDLNGRLITDSLTGMMQGMYGRRWQKMQALRGNTYRYPLHINDQRIGTVEITHLGRQGLLTGEAAIFRRTVTKTGILAILVMVLVVAAASGVLSRKLTKPLEKLTEAAQKFSRGQFATRVAVEGNDELAVLGNTLNQMARRPEEQAALRNKLTGDISHELRTPLTTVQSYLEAFLDGVLFPDKQNLTAVLEETHRLGALVNDLQELAAAECAVRELRPTALDLNLFISNETERIRPLFKQKEISLTQHLASGPVHVPADERMLALVLSNLLVNAKKYTSEGGEVSVSAFRDGSEAGFTVSDTGEGISREDLPHIFERFYRIDPSRTRATGGSGIGLSIVQELVSAMGGRVNVQSEPGKGSLFSVTFPAADLV